MRRTCRKVFPNSAIFCIHFLAMSPGMRVQSTLVHAIHSTKPNEILHFDFSYIGANIIDANYVLIIKEDLSSYTW